MVRQGSRTAVPYLTPPGLNVKHVACVMLQHEDLGKVHVLVEELERKRQSLVSAPNYVSATKQVECFTELAGSGISSKKAGFHPISDYWSKY